MLTNWLTIKCSYCAGQSDARHDFATMEGKHKVGWMFGWTGDDVWSPPLLVTTEAGMVAVLLELLP